MYTFSNSFLASPGKRCVFAEIRDGLGSGEKKKMLEALHMVSRNRLTAKQKALIFPQVVSLILHDSLELKCGAYSFVLRAIEVDKTLLLLVVNTVLQELRGSEERDSPSGLLKKTLAIDFVAKVRDKEFLGHFYDEIELGLKSGAEIVQKSALQAWPVLFRAFPETSLAEVRCALLDQRPGVVGSALQAVCAIETERRGAFEPADLVRALRTLCAKRAEIEEHAESFGMLFSYLCRLLRPFPNKEIVDSLIAVLPFLPLYAVRELVLSAAEHLSPSLAERIALSLVSYLGTARRGEALAVLRLLQQSTAVKLPVEPLLIAAGDGRLEKTLKLQLLAGVGNSAALAEIRLFLRDKECAFQAMSRLIELRAAHEDDIRAGFKHAPSATLRALYLQHPLPSALAQVVTATLQSLTNVSEKEAYLFLAGYYLTTIPDEAKRIRRIRNSAGGILYGKKEEREKSEEHLEEYLFFLLNFYRREILTKEECIKQATDAFGEEPFLLNKFRHLIDLPDQKHLLDLIAYKRISYKLSGLPQ